MDDYDRFLTNNKTKYIINKNNKVIFDIYIYIYVHFPTLLHAYSEVLLLKGYLLDSSNGLIGTYINTKSLSSG